MAESALNSTDVVSQRCCHCIARGQVSKEDAAVAAIKELGGEVTFDEENPGKPVIVNLLATEVTDAGLVHLKGLTSLHTVNLALTKVTDTGLVHLKGLTSLQTLNLSNTKVADAGLVHLKGFEEPPHSESCPHRGD